MEIFYYLENVTPYGSIDYNFECRNGQPEIDYIHSGISFGDISYECLMDCIKPYDEDAEVSKWGLMYEYTNYTFKRPTISLSVSISNKNKIGFRIQTIDKFFVILRNLSLAIIAGLIVLLFSHIIDKQANIKIIKRYIQKLKIRTKLLL